MASKKMTFKDPKASFNENVKLKGENAKQPDWKEELKSAYDTMANEQITASDKAYDKALAAEDNQALARGMGRSSYTLATRANLQNERSQAQNNIRANVGSAYQQAVLNQQNVQDQLAFQQAQFEYQQQQDAQAQANWQAQFDAQQAQQAWQNEYQQDLFKYQYLYPYQQAQAAAAQSAGAGSGSSYSPSSTPGKKDDDKNKSPWADFYTDLSTDTPPKVASFADMSNLFGVGGATTYKKPYENKNKTNYKLGQVR